MHKRILVDVDGVCANLVEYWLDCYNKIMDGEHVLTIDDIDAWDAIYNKSMLSHDEMEQIISHGDVYNHVKPIKDALDGVNFLRGHFDVYFCTACSLNTFGDKLFWLMRHGFLPDDYETSKMFYIEAHTKSIFNNSFDWLIDDSPNTITKWGVTGIMFTQPWNVNTRSILRLNNWSRLLSLEPYF